MRMILGTEKLKKMSPTGKMWTPIPENIYDAVYGNFDFLVTRSVNNIE